MSQYNYHSSVIHRPGDRILSEHDRLTGIVQTPERFTTQFGQAMAVIPVGDTQRRVCPIRSAEFRDWITQRFFADTGRLPQPRPLVAPRFQASGGFQGPSMPEPYSLTIDLANAHGEAVEITPDGWNLISSPYHFNRSRATRELPQPKRPEDPGRLLATLRRLLNPASDRDWSRLLVWLVSVVHSAGPYPVLVIHGPRHAGKSTAAHMLRLLTDPSWAPFSKFPSSGRETFAIAFHNWVIAYDHVQRFSPAMASAISRLSAGAAFTVRETGSDREPLSLFLRRPVLVTLHRPQAARPLLTDTPLGARCLTVQLRPFDSAGLESEAALWERFMELCPQFIGLPYTPTTDSFAGREDFAARRGFGLVAAKAAFMTPSALP